MTTIRECTMSFPIDGGRDYETCGQPAELQCSRCEDVVCPECTENRRPMYKVGEETVCDNCIDRAEQEKAEVL